MRSKYHPLWQHYVGNVWFSGKTHAGVMMGSLYETIAETLCENGRSLHLFHIRVIWG